MANVTGLEYIEEFNRQLKLLTVELERLYPEDHVVDRAKKRIMLAIETFPADIIHWVGPYLYKYKEEIEALDEQGVDQMDFFLRRDYAEELNESKDEENTDIAAALIGKAKDAFTGVDSSGSSLIDTEKKREYADIVVELLDNYIDFLCETKGLTT